MSKMTREEAIEILQGAIKKPNTKDGYLGQAIDMAIQALSQEPCTDAVNRQAALDAIYALCDTGETIEENPWRDNPHIDAIIDALDNLPPVTPKPETVTEFADRCLECGARYGKLLEQKSGHWISHYDEDEKVGWYECDRCHTERAFNTRFCPDCGAYMREGRTLDEFIEDSKESEVKE